MNHVEFSDEFDVLYNNIMSNAAPGLNGYEKSVFLTKAQEEIIKNHFNSGGNRYKEGFDDSLKRQIDFSELIKVGEGTLVESSSTTFDSRAKLYNLPEDVFIIINEAIKTDKGVRQIVPLSYNEYTRLMSRPFKEPLKYQAWRLITTSTDSITVELITNSNELITQYSIRYVRRPAPIILEDLSEYGTSINGISEISECELNPIIHQEILQRAVELAKLAYTGDLNSTVQLGERSE